VEKEEVCAACYRTGRGEIFLNFGAKSAESAVVVFAREWRRRKCARHAIGQGADRAERGGGHFPGEPPLHLHHKGI
jgi:hypothetical protein